MTLRYFGQIEINEILPLDLMINVSENGVVGSKIRTKIDQKKNKTFLILSLALSLFVRLNCLPSIWRRLPSASHQTGHICR